MEGSEQARADGSPELIDMVGARFEMVARMGTAEADTVLFRTHMSPGRVVPLHSHVDPECFYVLNGSIEVFTVGDTSRWHVVEAGRSLLVADGSKHAVRNITDRPADLILATNNRLARYFREAGRSAIPGAESLAPTPEDIERLLRVARDYGYWMASPAESSAVTG